MVHTKTPTVVLPSTGSQPNKEGQEWKYKCEAPSCAEETCGTRGFHPISGSAGIGRKLLVLISGEQSVVNYKNRLELFHVMLVLHVPKVTNPEKAQRREESRDFKYRSENGERKFIPRTLFNENAKSTC